MIKFNQYVEMAMASTGNFRTIVADPPWDVALGKNWKSRFTDLARPQRFYPTMSLEEIKTISVPSANQAHLYLWVVNQHMDWGFEVARAWGFPEYVQVITWNKPGLGCGQFQCNTEQCLLFRKGGRRKNAFGKTGGTGFNWSRGKHSEKPNDFYSLVEKTSPGPYLELFARKCRQGWTCLGNEVGKKQDIKDSLPQQE
jgi:N6-adenosine-specific RNA methylase IME4